MNNRIGLVGIGWVLVGLCVAAEPAAPPMPERYDVKLRYRIDAFPKERLEQYDALLKHFKDIGFDKDAGPDNEPIDNKATRMTGSIAAANATKLLGDPHVKSLLLWPHGSKLPEGDAPVRVRLQLANDLNRPEPPLLADQVRQVLAPLGFKEAVGYASHGNLRLTGMIPANKLEVLLEDLRKLPEGEKLGAPFATRSPLLVTEVMAGLPTKDRPVAAEPPKGQEKLTTELRNLLPADDKQPGNVARMEVILSHAAQGDQYWRPTLKQAAPNLAIEGRLGPIVTVSGPVTEALRLAASPAVSTIRLPRSGELRFAVDGTDNPSELLKGQALERLQALGRKGKKARVAVVDGDFRGWQGLVASKKLPAETRFLDLTTAHNVNLLPDSAAADDANLGVGSRFALAAAAAAPNAEFTLIRIDPASPYQLQEVARYINGEPVHSDNLENRFQELTDTRKELDLRIDAMTAERTIAYKSIAGEEEDVARKRREEFRKKEAKLAQDEKEYRAAMDRFVQLQRDLKTLKGIQAVISPLAWKEGQPGDRTSALSRYFDEDTFRGPLWIFPTVDTRGQTWSGLFRDVDGNGVMEFAAPDKPLLKDRWTSELNFLAWQPAKGERTVDLPANARFRVSIQWQEAHDADVTRFDTESYRMPLAQFRLMLLRQLDPSGKTQPADDLEVVAQSVGLPQRLESGLKSATYEQTVEFEVREPGRFALRVEGRVPPGIRPANAPTLPAAEVHWECRPRVFLQTLNGPGRVLFQDYADD